MRLAGVFREGASPRLPLWTPSWAERSIFDTGEHRYVCTSVFSATAGSVVAHHLLRRISICIGPHAERSPERWMTKCMHSLFTLTPVLMGGHPTVVLDLVLVRATAPPVQVCEHAYASMATGGHTWTPWSPTCGRVADNQRDQFVNQVE